MSSETKKRNPKSNDDKNLKSNEDKNQTTLSKSNQNPSNQKSTSSAAARPAAIQKKGLVPSDIDCALSDIPVMLSALWVVYNAIQRANVVRRYYKQDLQTEQDYYASMMALICFLMMAIAAFLGIFRFLHLLPSILPKLHDFASAAAAQIGTPLFFFSYFFFLDQHLPIYQLFTASPPLFFWAVLGIFSAGFLANKMFGIPGYETLVATAATFPIMNFLMGGDLYALIAFLIYAYAAFGIGSKGTVRRNNSEIPAVVIFHGFITFGNIFFCLSLKSNIFLPNYK